MRYALRVTRLHIIVLYITIMKILLILDIDETFQHLVTGRHSIPSDYPYEMFRFDQASTVYFRPGFADFLQYAVENKDWLTLGIWTYGNDVYAQMTHNYLIDRYNLPEDLFLLVYSESEIKYDLKNGLFEKDLRRIFMTHSEYTHENTFLVDNRPANIYHMANRENGIIVESFVPTNLYYNPWQDYMFDDLQHICELLRSAKPHTQPVFHKERVKIHNLRKFHKPVLVGGEKIYMMTVGKVDEDEYFQVSDKGFLQQGFSENFSEGLSQGLYQSFLPKGGYIKSKPRTKKHNKRWRQTRLRSQLRQLRIA